MRINTATNSQFKEIIYYLRDLKFKSLSNKKYCLLASHLHLPSLEEKFHPAPDKPPN